MKYKACCDRRCLLANCEIRDNGGCSCACSVNDKIESIKSVNDGHHLFAGAVYFPSKESREAAYNKLSDELKELEDRFNLIEAPKILRDLQEIWNSKFVEKDEL